MQTESAHDPCPRPDPLTNGICVQESVKAESPPTIGGDEESVNVQNSASFLAFIGSNKPSRFFRLQQQEDRQDQQLRLNGVTIARVRKYKIICRRISQHQSGEKPRPAHLLSQSATRSPDRQHRARQKKRIAKVPGSAAVTGFGYAIPVVKKSLQADHCEAPRIFAVVSLKRFFY